ncbi:MAG: hypothetical protein ABIO99_06320 [Candidatus Limnocylindria bacterium]
MPIVRRIVFLFALGFLGAMSFLLLTPRAGEVPATPPAPSNGSASQGVGKESDPASPTTAPSDAGAVAWVAVGTPYPSTLERPPTADDGQSKLWFHDGEWWGVLVDPSSGATRIHWLNREARTWVDTGVQVDERAASRADVLWDGEHLYVATGGRAAAAEEHVRLMRYSYDPVARIYGLDPEFPVQLTTGGVRALTMAKDTAEVVWVTYIADGRLWFTHSRETDVAWDVPATLPVEGASVGQDVAVLARNGGSIAVVWTNQADGAVYASSHLDGDEPASWSPTTVALQGQQLADNHLSARGLDGADGSSLHVVVKTSLDVLPNSTPTDVQMLLLTLRPDGTWESNVFGRLADRHTRPLLLVDDEQRQLYIFAVSPFGGGSVYFKRTSADEIALPPGKGAPMLSLPQQPGITSPTSTKQAVTEESGIVVLASDQETGRYVFGRLRTE